MRNKIEDCKYNAGVGCEDCKYNAGVGCEDKAGCDKCGWNPKVIEKRKDRALWRPARAQEGFGADRRTI